MRFAALLLVFSGCSFFTPPRILYNNDLIPSAQQASPEDYVVEEDGAITYAIEGLRVKVRVHDRRGIERHCSPRTRTGVFFSTNPLYVRELD